MIICYPGGRRMKRILFIFCLLLSMIVFTACEEVNNKDTNKEEYAIHFVDDSGKEINRKEPAKRIISLYSAHTENLFSLGLEEEIIGVGTSDIYPPKALEKDIYDYKSDPEKIISADPDLVLIRPFIKRGHPAFVEAIEKAGIPVVSLYPEKFEEFDDYIQKLGILTGKEEEAKNLLENFHKEINDLQNNTKDIKKKVKVYFESSEEGYKTVTQDSMAAKAIAIAGGINIAKDATALKEDSSIAAYGAEKILEKAEEIDVFVSQNGVMNAGGNKHSISTRPGFDTIKAVKNDKICIINQKIISSPTFRYIKGIKELARMFYPEKWDDLSSFKGEIRREAMAKMIIKGKHEEIFVPTSKYYKKEHKEHTYGLFKDVDIKDPSFDFIETAVTSGYMKGFKEGDKEMFYPNNKVTREEFATILFMIADLKKKEKNISIEDMEQVSSPKILQMVVDNQLMDLEGGRFHPQKIITGEEVISSIQKLKALNLIQ